MHYLEKNFKKQLLSHSQDPLNYFNNIIKNNNEVTTTNK
jgi:hypothetical protein